MAPELLRVEEAADRLSLSRAQTYRLVQQGVLPAVHLGPHGLRVPAEALDAWLAQQGGSAVTDEVLTVPHEGRDVLARRQTFDVHMPLPTTPPIDLLLHVIVDQLLPDASETREEAK